jgi:hypothetical protein
MGHNSSSNVAPSPQSFTRAQHYLAHQQFPLVSNAERMPDRVLHAHSQMNNTGNSNPSSNMYMDPNKQKSLEESKKRKKEKST